MKSRFIIIGLMIFSVLAISASAQRLTLQQIVLQDDKSGDHLIIVIPTGEYKFEGCKERLAISGVGSISVIGCKVTLKDFSDTRRVLVEVDLCEQTGKAAIAVDDSSLTSDSDSPLELVLSDSNTGDSAFDCTFKQIDPK
jgi:hypothetical protein